MLFAKDARFPSTILATRAFRDGLLMCSLRRVETGSRFLRTLYASFPWFCVQLDFYAQYAVRIIIWTDFV